MKEKVKHITSYFLQKLVKRMLLVSGAFFLFVVLFSFTTGPYWMYFHLGTYSAKYFSPPDYLIVLSGGSMPSEANLIRLYQAASLAKQYPKSGIILSMPTDSSDDSVFCGIKLMARDLAARGIDSTRILFEKEGKNTRAEALNILKLYPFIADKKIVIVTSPDHMLRSLKTFRKAGFSRVGGQAAFESVITYDLEFEEEELGGRKLPLPNLGDNSQLRYQFWNHLKYQLICYREYAALAYYWMKDWV